MPLLLVLLLSGCGLLPGSPSSTGPLTGEVSTSDGQTPPQGSELEIFLQEETEADVIGPNVAQGRQTISGPPPWSFQLRGDKRLHPDRLHVVRARIVHAGRVLYEKAAAVPVMTLGHPRTVQLELKRRAED